MPDISPVIGLVFVTNSGDEYGIIREAQSEIEHPVTAIGLKHIADDESGNAFARQTDGSIVFWDHETDDVTELARDWDAFIAGCTAPTPAQLDQQDIRSAWIDPEFAKEQGVDAPPNGWLKKPKE